MSSALNFTFELVIPPNGTWGAEVEPGIWNGLPGLFQQKIINISVAALTKTPQRMTVMDFANIPLEYSYVVAMYRKPEMITNTLYLYLRTFKTIVWSTLLGTFIIISLVISTIYYAFESRNHENRRRTKYDIKTYGIKLEDFKHMTEMIFNIFSSFFKQTVFLKQKFMHEKVIWESWWIFSFIFTSYWSAILISFIATPVYPTVFTNIWELESQDLYKIGVLRDTSWETTIKESYPNIWKRINNFYKTDPSVLSGLYDEHVNKVETDDYVTILSSTSADRILRKNCKVTVATKFHFGSNLFAIGMQKNSAYREVLDLFSLHIQEFGLLEHLSKVYQDTDVDNSCDQSENTPIVLKLYHFYWWLYLFTLFIFLSICLFLCEKLFYSFIL